MSFLSENCELLGVKEMMCGGGGEGEGDKNGRKYVDR